MTGQEYLSVADEALYENPRTDIVILVTLKAMDYRIRHGRVFTPGHSCNTSKNLRPVSLLITVQRLVIVFGE